MRNTFVGIDIAKAELVACLIAGEGVKPRTKTFKNTACGHRALVTWATKGSSPEEVHFCMEATGCYHMDVATFLAEQRVFVSVVEPRRIKHFGVGMGLKNKTDKADSFVIARYAQVQKPSAWHLVDPIRRQIDCLSRRMRQLSKARNQESNRLQNTRLHELVVSQIHENIKRFQEQEAAISKEILKLLSEAPKLKKLTDVLQRVKGIGVKTAIAFACLIDPDQFESAKQVAVFAGLNPVLRQSGTINRKTSISKAGQSGFRSAFYFPTIIAMKSLQPLSELARRLKQKGLKPKQVIAACMRKLLMICYGIAKNLTRGLEVYNVPQPKT